MYDVGASVPLVLPAASCQRKDIQVCTLFGVGGSTAAPEPLTARPGADRRRHPRSSADPQHNTGTPLAEQALQKINSGELEDRTD